MVLWLFVLGLAVGSFVNVLALRYEPEHFIFKKSSWSGRSFCPQCKSPLKWHELIPLVSYALQRGRCRTCKSKISPQYPIVELVSGLIFVFVPNSFSVLFPLSSFLLSISSVLWIAVFTTLLLVTLIDLRLRVIPDEANIFLAALGVILLLLAPDTRYQIPDTSSFLGSYALIFGLQNNPWLNHFIAALVGAVFFLSLVLITRGRGMGMGDVKLASVLGFLFGWPDIFLLIVLSFVVGSLFGLYAMARRGYTMKSAIPFGPFLAAGAALTFFFGEEIVRWYFGLFSL
jgi:leader peptidase (prepilin peptidase)/N-methyltransferase